jgi:hypothetical protein
LSPAVGNKSRYPVPSRQQSALNQVKAIKVDASWKGNPVMKRNTAIAFLAIANFAMAGTSFAQSNGVKATIPFDFSVGDKHLPAGTYTIKEESDHMIVIKNHDQPIAMLSLVNPDSSRSPNGGKLKFHRYGRQYFLSEILCDEADMNLQVPASRTEKRTALQEAKLSTRSETLVAAR